MHAPVGSFARNPFGLHDVHGNVWEWCLDGSGDYRIEPAPDTGERLSPDPGSRSYRGGSFIFAASLARSANRVYHPPETKDFSLGVRPAAALRE